MSEEERGSIAFFSTYRPPVPLDIYCSPISPDSDDEEELMTDGKSYNYNGKQIPPGSLKTMLIHTKLGQRAYVSDVDSGHVTGLIFVSERTKNLETLHVALRFKDGSRTRVYNFAELYGTYMKDGVRMEDSPSFAGKYYLVFVSTYDTNDIPRQPWTAVFRTDLRNGHTIRLTPQGVSDFSPSVSPSGRKIAVATLENNEGGWTGEIEDLETDIVVMDLKYPEHREFVIEDGGWPSWGSEDIIFFHRATRKQGPNPNINYFNWGVFRANIRHHEEDRVTPRQFDAMTPAAIDQNRVAVAIIYKKLDIASSRYSPNNYRHIAIFDTRKNKSYAVTRCLNATIDHYNPFIINDCSTDDGLQIGYNSCIGKQLQKGEIADNFNKLDSDHSDEMGIFRVPGVFPTFTEDGEKLAFVDNDFQNVYLADTHGGVRVIFSVTNLKLAEDENSVFSPVWNQDEKKDTLYVCVGPAFSANKQVHIYAIFYASDYRRRRLRKLTTIPSNNAFPSTNPEGTRLVFRSTRDWVGKAHKSSLLPKNLYIMEDVRKGDGNTITRLTKGDWTDTHCQWSPNGLWIVFSSTRDKPKNSPSLDNGLDPGYFAVYLMNVNNRHVVRVISSGCLHAGHVNHPMFSPDGESIVFTADLAGVSVEPISMPLFIHSVRPYGDIFMVNINPDDIYANKDLTNAIRLTHSRYENSTPSWSWFSTEKLSDEWKDLFRKCYQFTWACPFSGEKWQTNAALTGQLCLAKRCC